MHDTGVEDRLRVAFRSEADELGLTITAAELDRRLVARRGSRNGRRLSLMAAGIAIVAVGMIGALSNGWLRFPAVGTTGGPSPSPSASAPPAVQIGSEPPPSAPASPSAFTPPAMQVGVSTLGVPGATVSLTTACSYDHRLADGTGVRVFKDQPASGGCADPQSAEPACCAVLDVPWGADLTFSMPGWVMSKTEIDTISHSWIDDRPAPSIRVLGWVIPGAVVLQVHSTFTKDGVSFTATYPISIHGPLSPPVIATPEPPCGKPDLSVATPPSVRLFVDGKPSVIGEFGTTGWNGSSTDVPFDPQPAAALPLSAGAALGLRIAGDVCASHWTITYGAHLSADPLTVDPVGSLVLAHGPQVLSTAVANRFTLADLPPGDWYIEARLDYIDGGASVGWHVIVK